MPSPVGHALAGVAAGCLISRVMAPAGSRRERPPVKTGTPWRRRLIVTFGVLGVSPDLDFVFGAHSAYTHSIGATVVVGLLAGVVALTNGDRGPRLALACAAAYGSHALLDYLGSDTVAPLGIMALWPASDGYYLSDWHWFMSVCRQYREIGCWAHNAVGVVQEVLLVAPLTALAVWIFSVVPTRTVQTGRNRR